MKKLLIIAGIAAVGASVAGCGGAKGNDPGNAYMPDMYYSRAYEAYGYNNVGDYELLKEKGVFYNGLPVEGTMARGDVSSFPLPANEQAASYRNPFDMLTVTADQKKEAERLYLVNCAICHGTNLDGNGPLWKGGDGPYPAAPRNLKDDYSKKLPDGQMYHAIVYGKGQMGSYASQLKPAERWWVINYIREKQGPAKAAADSTAAAATTGTPSAGADTTTKK
jgi:mono/diheme cytochrome c family protein